MRSMQEEACRSAAHGESWMEGRREGEKAGVPIQHAPGITAAYLKFSATEASPHAKRTGGRSPGRAGRGGAA